MAGKIDARLAELGIEIATPAAPQANYVPFVISGNLVYVSGQVPVVDGEVRFKGKVGDDVDVATAAQAARACAMNLIAQVKAACDGDLDRVTRVVRLGGFVNATADFTEQPQVINGASDLLVDVFGDAGRHARFAVGAGSLPLGVSVEIDAVFEIS
ncbi:MAG: RidA family protein [Alphaproteobacteria bacterium]|jgi:enamine deaminase RidA (YjgF/YER057c/UK114 family)|nr:RidA family protein [Alphaproteobacteria bacterium]MBT4082289.1 RidA family protein [Alphaproteobacteria bacterium]MBT4542810.1 RidA family protein [Alphaproteobacteria bacterium]MBT7744210.1 RidA family protein [Alphaproteobacteria bacterium]